MGGRGASSGTSKKGHRYGSQYRSLFQVGNIKFVEKRVSGAETLLETMAPGRVYAYVNPRGKLASVVFFDSENKRSRQIDLTHTHDGMVPHVHEGYLFEKGDHPARVLNAAERAALDNVVAEWEKYKRRQR